jgi:hypothetical protein
MPPAPVELTFEIQPQARLDIIDVRRWTDACRRTLDQYPRALYWSYHPTAGYLPQSLALHLTQTKVGIAPYMQLFQTLFPAGAGYRHDDLEWRAELSNHQRRVEPRKADVHLAYIASDLRNCARYVNRRDTPVYFIDLDGACSPIPGRSPAEGTYQSPILVQWSNAAGRRRAIDITLTRLT